MPFKKPLINIKHRFDFIAERKAGSSKTVSARALIRLPIFFLLFAQEGIRPQCNATQ